MQSALGPAIDAEAASEGAKPRRPEEWVRVGVDASPVRGFECVVQVTGSGEYWIGRLLSWVCDPFVEIEIFGALEGTPSKLFDRGEVRVSLLPWHTWAERQAVRARQRRGEPAAVRAPRAPRARAAKAGEHAGA